ncbi:MAG: hypothetical protein HHAS10_03860 [Candidatus Altimarinota bacterium]
MEGFDIKALDTAAERIGGEKLLSFRLTKSDGGILMVNIVTHRTMKKVAVLLGDDFQPIEFDTPFGKKVWVNGWGLLHGTKYLLIEDGATHSLGIYRLDGSQSFLTFQSALGTPEVIYRIRRLALKKVDENGFALHPMISTLLHMPALGPE